jgi:UDP-glucose:(heptosyl)LPS alpha-1,3-glucosyltransferase
LAIKAAQRFFNKKAWQFLRFAFLIFKYFPYGGVQRDMLRIARQLVGMGNSVDIYTMSWDGPLPEQGLPGTGISVHIVEAHGLLNHKRYEDFIRHALGAIQDAAPSLVVGFNRTPGLDAYFAADPCFEERARRERGFFYRLLGRYRSFAACERAVFDREGHCEILTLTPDAKDAFQRWYGTPDNRFHLLTPYLSAERMALRERAQMRARARQEFGLSADDRILLMVGSGFERKGLDRAIIGLASLPPEVRARTHLLVVGEGNEKKFKGMAEVLGVTANLHIAQGRTDVPELMQGADLLVHPAHHEMAGHVILEAMASGLPVLLNENCGYAFHVQKAQAGRLLPTPFDQEDFNRNLAEMLGSNTQETWRENGIAYTRDMMRANDGGAEAAILIGLAKDKLTRENAHVAH